MESMLASYLRPYFELFLNQFDVRKDFHFNLTKGEATVSNLGKARAVPPRRRIQPRARSCMPATCRRVRSQPCMPNSVSHTHTLHGWTIAVGRGV